MASAGGTRSVGRGLARVEPSSGVLVAYSARDGHVAQDGDGTTARSPKRCSTISASQGLRSICCSEKSVTT